MCGIAGCLGRRDEQTINRMLDAMTHRGPNDRGIHLHGDHVFGHTRLSIVDVAGGHQPILAKGARPALSATVKFTTSATSGTGLSPKYPFTTHSDSEVALHLVPRTRTGRGPGTGRHVCPGHL
jgi:asparagine synthase (glutamine-hydrolysing)